MTHPFYEAIGIDANERKNALAVAKQLGISVKKLDYYDENAILPDETDLEI